jgi:DNA-binding CsgD family transcriptional regulator
MTTIAAFRSVAPKLKCFDGASSVEPIGLCYRLPTLAQLQGLTAAEGRIVRGLLSGYSNQQLGVHGGVSSRTIAVQMQRLFDKIGVSSRHELLAALLNSEGSNLNAAYLAERTQVFSGERMLVLSRDGLSRVGREDWVVRPNASEVWDQVLSGTLALQATHAMGDLRFLVLNPTAEHYAGGREVRIQTEDLILLKGLASGRSNQRLAQDLAVSNTVLSIWARRALAKLGMTHRAELIRLLSAAASPQSGARLVQ